MIERKQLHLIKFLCVCAFEIDLIPKFPNQKKATSTKNTNPCKKKYLFFNFPRKMGHILSLIGKEFKRYAAVEEVKFIGRAIVNNYNSMVSFSRILEKRPKNEWKYV